MLNNCEEIGQTILDSALSSFFSTLSPEQLPISYHSSRGFCIKQRRNRVSWSSEQRSSQA
jgi:hypothetical protein